MPPLSFSRGAKLRDFLFGTPMSLTIYYWSDDHKRIEYVDVASYVCVIRMTMRWCCEILEWWLQTDRICRHSVVCVFWSGWWWWCDVYVVKYWSDDYKRIACVVCVCVCVRSWWWCDVHVVKSWSDDYKRIASAVCHICVCGVIRMMKRWCCQVLEWWLQTDRIRRHSVVCVCMCVRDPDDDALCML